MKIFFASLVYFSVATLLITCRKVDSVIPNRPPVADAGQDIATILGQSVGLNGAGSSDPDKSDGISYTWTFISKPSKSVVKINDFDLVQANFTPDQAGVYSLRLLVSDNIASDADTLEVAVAQPHGAPIVDAGKDGQADLGTLYNLAGTAVDPKGDALIIVWTLTSKPSGSVATIQNPSTLKASFSVDKPGTYVAHLQVSNSTFTVSDDVSIATNPVTVTSINPTSGPYGITVKIAGKNFSSTPGENNVTFNGSVATVAAANYTGLDVIVPKGAGTGSVAVKVNAITSAGPVFTYVVTPTVSTVAQFDSPIFMTADANGNLYISDFNSHVIRMLTPSGQLSIIAGTGKAGYVDSKPLTSQFNQPAGIAIDKSNNIYVADYGNQCIRKISLSSGVVSTFAGFPKAGYVDGKSGTAQFNSPMGLAIDAAGNLYVGDSGNGRVRKVLPSGFVSTLAITSAVFNGVTGVTVDANTNVYVSEATGYRISKIDAQETVSVLAGSGTLGFVNGTGKAARFNLPYGLACDAAANVYVADFNNNSVRKITSSGVVTTVAGNGIAGFVEGTNAQFNQPTGVTLLPDGSIAVADFTNQRIRLITFE